MSKNQTMNRDQRRSLKDIGNTVSGLIAEASKISRKLMECINSVNVLNEDFNVILRLAPVDVLQNGDTVVIDYFGRLVNEDGSLGDAFQGGSMEGLMVKNLGSGQLVPGFEDQLVGKKVGETLEIDLTFPEEYTPSLSGKKVKFFVSIMEALRNQPNGSYIRQKIEEYNKELKERKEKELAAKNDNN